METVQITELGKQTLKVIDARNARRAIEAREPETKDFWERLEWETEYAEATRILLREREIEFAMEKAINEAIAKPEVKKSPVTVIWQMLLAA